MLFNSTLAIKQDLLLRLDSAVAAARGAGRLILDKDVSKVNIRSKGLNDIVTDMDSASERFIIDFLKVRFPDDNFLGEELGEISSGKGGRWIIDPIDGTDNYVHNIPNYSVSIGYENVEGVLSIGIVYNPCQDELFHAVKGGGAFLNGKPISVSGIKAPSLSLFIVSPPFRMHDKASIYFKILETIFMQAGDIRRFGSAALDLCYIACGRADAFFEFGLQSYDIAAGLVILSEAGGNYSTFLESEKLFVDGNLIATNGYLQTWYREQICDILRE